MQEKILVVDDELEILELIAFNLKADGYEVVTAADGVAAIHQVRALVPDLIILDLMLPEMDGFTVCEILQRSPTTAHIPIIMLTAWSSELSRIIGLQIGAKDYIAKPFSPRELMLCVKGILLRSQKLNPPGKLKTTLARKIKTGLLS
ncbi:MAG: response regulator [Verrucomicrobiota bacterium]|jgi:DNA-binding response OmpR family regulator